MACAFPSLRFIPSLNSSRAVGSRYEQAVNHILLSLGGVGVVSIMSLIRRARVGVKQINAKHITSSLSH